MPVAISDFKARATIKRDGRFVIFVDLQTDLPRAVRSRPAEQALQNAFGQTAPARFGAGAHGEDRPDSAERQHAPTESGSPFSAITA